MQSWYALQTKPQAERIVNEVLTARGMEPYLPLWNPSPRAKLVNALRPYFPSYLFVRCDLQTVGISSLQYTPGVRRLIFAGDQPVCVGDIVIEELRMRLIELNKQMASVGGYLPKPGERVVITNGVFAGYEALFDRQLSSGVRVRVLIDFLNKRMPVEMDSAHIRKKQL